jgi:hypothetical protein
MNRISGLYQVLIVAVIALVSGCSTDKPSEVSFEGTSLYNNNKLCPSADSSHHSRHCPKHDDTSATPEPEPVPEPEPTPVPLPCGMGCFTTDANTIAHWTFDGASNGVVADQGVNGFNATVFGTPTFSTAACGNAINLSGSGQYLDAFNWNRFAGYKKVTIDVMFKIYSMRDDGTASGDMISELVNDHYWYPIGGVTLRVRNTVCQFAIGSTSGWQHLTDVTPVSFGEWHHASASFDVTTKTMTLQLDCSAPVSMIYSGEFVTTQASYLRIGSCVVNPPSRFVNGAIDAVIIKGWK